MNLLMSVLAFLGVWFVVSVVYGLFVGACFGEKRHPIAVTMGGRPVAPGWTPVSGIERRHWRGWPVAIADRARHVAHHVA